MVWRCYRRPFVAETATATEGMSAGVASCSWRLPLYEEGERRGKKLIWPSCQKRKERKSFRDPSGAYPTVPHNNAPTDDITRCRQRIVQSSARPQTRIKALHTERGGRAVVRSYFVFSSLSFRLRLIRKIDPSSSALLRNKQPLVTVDKVFSLLLQRTQLARQLEAKVKVNESVDCLHQCRLGLGSSLYATLNGQKKSKRLDIHNETEAGKPLFLVSSSSLTITRSILLSVNAASSLSHAVTMAQSASRSTGPSLRWKEISHISYLATEKPWWKREERGGKKMRFPLTARLPCRATRIY